jgi:hypothetical protein
MELVATLGRTLGFSLAAGVNLYATVARCSHIRG